MRQIGLGKGKPITRPQGRSIRSSANLSSEQRMAMVYTTPQWRKLRAFVRQHWPMCCGCGAAGEMVDHIVPINIAPDRAFDITNLQVLCRYPCHDIKTKTIDAPGGFATNYNYNKAKTEADKRPEQMKRWAVEIKASGALPHVLKGKGFADGDEVTC